MEIPLSGLAEQIRDWFTETLSSGPSVDDLTETAKEMISDQDMEEIARSLEAHATLLAGLAGLIAGMAERTLSQMANADDRMWDSGAGDYVRSQTPVWCWEIAKSQAVVVVSNVMRECNLRWSSVLEQLADPDQLAEILKAVQDGSLPKHVRWDALPLPDTRFQDV